MGRPKGTKNNMRTPEEKENIIIEFYSGKIGRNEICRKYKIGTGTLRKWRQQYKEFGIEGLKSQSGKFSKGRSKNPTSYEEELKLKIMKLEIENARLKKGYLVIGGGVQKEYVTTLEKSMK